MATLVDCATIFQLSFGVNAILPAMTLAYRGTQENVVRWLAREIDKRKPELAIEESEMGEFRDFVTDLNPGLSSLDSEKWIPISASGISLIASFFGLVLAAITPDHKMPNGALWLFAIYSLVFCPSLAVFFTSKLRFHERQLIKLWSRNRRVLINTALAFRELRETDAGGSADAESETRQLEEQAKILKTKLEAAPFINTLWKRRR